VNFPKMPDIVTNSRNTKTAVRQTQSPVMVQTTFGMNYS